MRSILVLALLTLSAATLPAHAETLQATVVATCGTPPSGFNPPYQFTQDTTGTLCASASCTATPVSPAYVAGQTDPIVVDSSGTTCAK